MSYAPNDDLFESSKMTFGEHLEELRTCLVKSLIGLAIGFLIALLFANWVVKQIQVPLSQALEKYYFEASREKLLEEYPQASEDLIAFMQEQDMVFEEVYWELDELERLEELRRQLESGADVEEDVIAGLRTPKAPTTRPFKTRIWKPQEAPKSLR